MHKNVIIQQKQLIKYIFFVISFNHSNIKPDKLCSRYKYLRKNSKTQMTKILNIINHRQLHSEPILPERYRGMLGLDIRRCLRVWCRSCGGCRSR